MALDGVLQLLDELPAFVALRERVAGGAAASASPVNVVAPDAAHACLIAALWNRVGRTVLVLAPRPDDADRLAQDLAAFVSPPDPETGSALAPVLRLPESQALPYERLAEDAAVAHARLTVLAALARTGGAAREGSPLVVSSVAALLQRTLSHDTFRETRHVIRVGDAVQVSALMARWTVMGYVTEVAVEVPGTISRRGGILDVFPPHRTAPVRIELWGDNVESIRSFDPATQRSEGPVDEVEIIPAWEAEAQALAAADPDASESGAPDVAGAVLAELSRAEPLPAGLQRVREDLERLAAGEFLEEAGAYAGLLSSGSVLDYLPDDALVITVDGERASQVAAELEEQATALRDARVGRGELPVAFPSPWWSWREVRERLTAFPGQLEIGWRSHSPDADLGIALAPSFWGRFDAFAADASERARAGERVFVLSHNAERLAEVLGDYGIGVSVEGDLARLPERGAVTLAAGALPEGFLVPLSSGPLALFTDNEIFGQAKRRRALRRHAARREAFLTEIVPGNYVVHVDHGIGRFVGTQQVGGADDEREYLTLEYAEGDRLYVPTDHLDRLSPYVAPGDSPPSLTRLGTQEWARAKERARTAAREMAEELITLYATRDVLDGHAFPPDTPWQRELEDAFPYVETRDQAEAIEAVKAAMEAPHPMDHLVCGDVGYGKTEIAVRAAFKAVQDGTQAALLCPTTVLAQQHYLTFKERLSPFPVTVELLSRFRTPQEQQGVIEKLRDGSVDIVIGTHRLVQKDVAFKNLGLVVVDDEQRFGVTHKERFKQLRQEVDVLTLTATPIPRTLSMALGGIRDMTTIHTPPEERQPVRTFVSEYTDELVRETILRELDRGGQAFFVHNRVRDILEWAARVQALVPRAKVAVGHGRMDEDDLAAVMADFTAAKADVLVCTTIIESGLDIPNVNTIIVHRPELLGLAQMYQLRGRVGRGNRSAQAYFLTPPGRQLTEAAEKRLKAILAYQELGAGFRIAMKDLEIRGAGNILGAEQSGHLHAVGFDLYTRLLEEAVMELRAERGEAPTQPPPASQPPQATVSLPLPAFIPESYITDLPQRLGVYQRLALASDTEEAVVLGAEIRDRFGPLPESVANLVYTVRVKVLAAAAGVEMVAKESEHVVLRLKEGVGGAAPLLQKELGAAVQVGDMLARVPLRGRWQEVVVWTLERMAAFRERMLGMPDA